MESYKPPISVQKAAKQGLELRRRYNRGGTSVGVARAVQLSSGRNVSLSTLKRMKSYFARHSVDKNSVHWNDPSAGKIAWLLWGGDAGKSWSEGLVARYGKQMKLSNPSIAPCPVCLKVMKVETNPCTCNNCGTVLGVR